MPNRHPLSILAARSWLMLSLFVAALIVVNESASAKAPPTFNSVPFQTVQLPPAALSPPRGFAPQRTKNQNPKLDSTVNQLATRARTSAVDAVGLAKAQSLRVSGDKVYLQISIRAGSLASVIRAIVGAGGQVTGVGNGNTLLQGWLPVGALETIAAERGVLMMRRPAEAQLMEQPAPQAGSSTTEALPAINAPAWHAAGFTGGGIKIGVIDGGFQGYPNLLGSDLPASVIVKNFVDGENDTQVNGGGVHGTACAEIIHDVAPGAQIFLAKVNTNIDLAEAVAWLKDTIHVNIISTSLGWYNVTPGDGTGEFADLVGQARAAGILWFTAAGNDREAHWGGQYADSDADNIHNFNGTQEVNYFGPGDGSAYLIPAGYAFRVFLRWDDWTNHNQDYDLYLFRWNGSSWTQVASSENFQDGGAGQTPTEYAAVATSGAAAPYGFIIQRFNSTRNVNLEVFAPKITRLDELLHTRSLANLADAPAAVTVAALDVNNPYPQESYSSEGPTNGAGGTAAGGANKPDISGYANVSTESYKPDLPYKFNGTSAATPHVAGAAALALSANPGYTPNQLESFLENRAVDLGAPGVDALFGYGRLFLGGPPSTISIGDASVTEGNVGTATMVFTANLSPSSTQPVTVTYATANGSATAPGDYTAIPSTILTFEPGQTTRTISVTVQSDRLVEGNETFAVNLANPLGATILDGQALGTIVDDDGHKLYLPMIRR